jgi:hypothetical protein
MIALSMMVIASVGSQCFGADKVGAQMPPTIDGKLNDAVWKKAQPIGKFMVLESTRASDLKTFGYVAYDDTHLYLAMNCLDSEPKSIAAQVAEPGEEVFRDDRVEIQPYVGK